jgi:Tfp pilus assembly protein PilN
VREVEFLPDWYPKVRRHKRTVVLQVWVTVLLVGGLGLWMLLAQRDVKAREVELASLRTDLTQSEAEVQQLEQLQQVQRDLGRQMEIYLKIGRPIETTRVMTTLEQLMPVDMALLDLSLETEEPARPAANTLAARAAQRGGRVATGDQPTRLKFRLHGVAPNDMDLAEFLAKLTGKPFFRDVELVFSHERSERGHLMREFELTFVMELADQPAGVGR